MLIQFDVDVCLEIEGATANTTQDRWVDSRSTKWINLYKWGGDGTIKNSGVPKCIKANEKHFIHLTKMEEEKKN